MDALLIRGLNPEIADRFKRAGGARGMTHSEFLGALIALWDAVRARADAGDDALQAELAALGLQTVQR